MEFGKIRIRLPVLSHRTLFITPRRTCQTLFSIEFKISFEYLAGIQQSYTSIARLALVMYLQITSYSRQHVSDKINIT